MLGARCEHFQALFLRAPLQNIDIDVTDAPALHVEAARLVKVDGVSPDECDSVVIDDVFIVCTGKPEPGSKREARPIRRGAHHVAAGKPAVECIVTSASFAVRVGSGTHVLHVLPTDEGRLRLRRTANDQASDNSCDCKVKALRHLQCRALNNNWTSRMQALILRVELLSPESLRGGDPSRSSGFDVPAGIIDAGYRH